MNKPSPLEPRIAFCTSAMNRVWQIKQTLPHNLRVLKGSPHFIALCDFGSSDGLEDYVRQEFSSQVASGQLIFFRTAEPRSFHSSKARNTAHRLALSFCPQFVFNLDADNFLSTTTVTMLERQFSDDGNRVVHQWTHSMNDIPWAMNDSTFARIGLSGINWLKVGGYDEELPALFWNNVDFLLRCRIHSLPYLSVTEDIPPSLKETVAQKLENIAEEFDVADPERAYDHLRIRSLRAMLKRPGQIASSTQRSWRGTLNFHKAAEV